MKSQNQLCKFVRLVTWYSYTDVHLQIRKGADQEWRDLHIPNSVRAIVMINLQTYMGGCDLWGMHEHHMPEETAKSLKKPIFDDGLIEVSLSNFSSLACAYAAGQPLQMKHHDLSAMLCHWQVMCCAVFIIPVCSCKTHVMLTQCLARLCMQASVAASQCCHDLSAMPCHWQVLCYAMINTPVCACKTHIMLTKRLVRLCTQASLAGLQCRQCVSETIVRWSTLLHTAHTVALLCNIYSRMLSPQMSYS